VRGLPRPTGPFAIGTVTRHWVDYERADILSADPRARRELMVQVWYPAHDDRAAPRAPYLTDADAVGGALARFLGVPAAALAPLGAVTTNAVVSAPVADDEPFYPVLIMLVGIKGSYRQVQTFQAEELASHGYVVVALDQPGTVAMVVFPDGRQVAYDERWDPPHSAFMDEHIPYLAGDVSFVLDQLATLGHDSGDTPLHGRLDLDRVGVVGHSFGAIVGGEACSIEPRIRAGLLEEGFMPADVVGGGLRQPIMFITRDAESMRLERRMAGGWPESDIRETLGTMRTVYEDLPGPGYFVEVPGMFHLDMTDAALLADLVAWPGLAGPIGAGRAHRIVNAYSVAFFDRALRGRPTPLLDGLSEQFPEVIFAARGS
jgi:predicted dienelactone hydrolase